VEVSSRAFSQIYEQHKPGALGWGAGEHLRGDLAGTKLYTHSAFSISGFGEAAAKNRQAKWAAGAAFVKNAIDDQFGKGVGDRVFSKISSEGGPDLNKELRRGDLERIRRAIGEVVPGAIPEIEGGKPSGSGEKAGGPGGPAPLKAKLNDNQVAQAEVFGLAKGQEPGTVTRSEATEKALKAMFGRSLSDAEIRGLGGMPESCDVELGLVPTNDFEHRDADPKLPGVSISMGRKGDASGAFRAIQMTLYRDRGGNVNLYRDSTRTNTGWLEGSDKPRPSNLGACALVKQVDTAREVGVSTIHNFATRGRGYNGYYTWARYGGNSPLTPDKIKLRDEDRGGYERFMKALAGSSDPDLSRLAGKRDLEVQDLMSTQKGRDFWKEHGFPIPLEFDLRPGSKTMQMFDEYTVPNSCFDLRSGGR
jgi:hypothetical protein